MLLLFFSSGFIPEHFNEGKMIKSKILSVEVTFVFKYDFVIRLVSREITCDCSGCCSQITYALSSTDAGMQNKSE